MSGSTPRPLPCVWPGDEDREMVVAEIENAYRIGVTGVPCFIMDRGLAVTGAHPAEVLVQAIEQAVAERETT